jgi:hypothetical protein
MYKIIKVCNVNEVLVRTLWNCVLENANGASYQMFSKKSKLRYQKQLEKFTSERKPVSEREVNERETCTYW